MPSASPLLIKCFAQRPCAVNAKLPEQTTCADHAVLVTAAVRAKNRIGPRTSVIARAWKRSCKTFSAQ